ncbi:MAG TPA: hypothetical protein PLO51_05805, partial [Candidatus Micrarchaeota archaeon]|nr:hypothetical protein [Candidatus Micrarchaeota archaeon]
EGRKRAYNDFLKEMGHSPQFVALVANIKTYQQDADGKMAERRSSSNDLRREDIVGISQQLLANPQLAQLAAGFKARQEQKRDIAGTEQVGLPKRIVQAR